MIEKLRCMNCDDTFTAATTQQLVDRFKSHECFRTVVETNLGETTMNTTTPAPYDWAKEDEPQTMTVGVWPLAAIGTVVCLMLVFTAAIMGGKL